MTTVSAVCRFNPRPAALMESKKMNLSLCGALKSLMAISLCSRDVVPSMRQYFKSCPSGVFHLHWRYVSSKSRSFVIVENKSTR